ACRCVDWRGTTAITDADARLTYVGPRSETQTRARRRRAGAICPARITYVWACCWLPESRVRRVTSHRVRVLASVRVPGTARRRGERSRLVQQHLASPVLENVLIALI